MVILWKKGSLCANYSFSGYGYVGINATRDGVCFNLVNMYAPCNMVLRRRLWAGLIDRRLKSGNEKWCLGGDFNEITSRVERLGFGGGFNLRGMKEFREFIESMGVVDIPCVGKFSWFKDNGKAMSRIDRFLVSESLIDDWGVLDQRIVVDWGPKPFRFNNAWINHKDFKEFICNEWAKLKIDGRGDFILFEKLKLLKAKIRIWNREVFGWIDLKVSEEPAKINVLDNLVVENFDGDIEPFVKARKEATCEFWNNLWNKLWLHDGDKNT
ncbi:uncharacterized protein LOC131650307 [Vicia villosa]|uniref:uncharacterized protein LOC131650307 n=1 Tax=Vicia villosa TaxID=3911 RepID=UPI00273C7A54|nr:uncharacterized protein LOC131650307 [Vicia villosa]